MSAAPSDDRSRGTDDGPGTGSAGLRRWSRILVAAATLSLLAFLWTSAQLPVPTSPTFQHLDGAIAATLDRVRAGGALYAVPSAESAEVQPCYPYFPGMLLLCAAVERVVPTDGPVAVSRIVGLALVFVLLAAVGLFCRMARPGSSLGFAMSGFSILLLLAAFCPTSPITVFPDFVVAAGLLTVCVLVERMERDPAGPRFLVQVLALGVSLTVAGLAKQNAVALFVGSAGYVLFRSRLPGARRAAVLLVEVASAAVVLAVVLAIPGAWMVTVRSIGAQAIVFAPSAFGELLVDYWPVVILVALLVSSRDGVWGNAIPSRIVSCFLWMWVPLLLLQTLSRFKWGGGRYNFALPALLLVPLLAMRIDELLGRRLAARLANALLLLTTATALLQRQETLENLRKLRVEFDHATSVLRQSFAQQPVVYDAALYPVLARAGVKPGVEWITVIHFKPVDDGRRIETAARAVSAGDYAALVFPTYLHFYPRPKAYRRLDDRELPWWMSVWVPEHPHPR